MLRRLVVCKLLCIVSLFPALAHALAVDPGNAWAGIFAGKVTPHELTLSGERNSYALLSWELVLKGRTLSRGQQDIRFGNAETITVALPLQVPPLKPGINLEAKLMVALASGGQSNHKVHYESSLRIYGPDPLLSDRDVYRQLDIQLFDPHGSTSKALDDLKIPYAARSTAQILAQSTKGLTVIGAGVAFERRQGLMNALMERAGAGQRILILQPVSGAFAVSGLSADSNSRPTTLSFADASIVATFAKGYHWISDTYPKAQSLSLRNHREAVVVKIAGPDKGGWDWVDIDYGQSGGGFIVCMLPFDRYIHQGPVPQLILGRLLAYAHGQSGSSTSTTKRKK